MVGHLYCPSCKTNVYSSNYLQPETHICPTCQTPLTTAPATSDPSSSDTTQPNHSDTTQP